jgi:CDP-diacylglycerol---serine O-phosphatidyltransferase
VLLPIYAAFLDLGRWPAAVTAGYTLLIAFLMVSRLPVFSGKTVRMRVPPELVLPMFVGVIFFIALLISYPWHILLAGSVLYLLSLPLGWRSYQKQARASEAASPAPVNVTPPGSTPTLTPNVQGSPHDDRPERLH